MMPGSTVEMACEVVLIVSAPVAVVPYAISLMKWARRSSESETDFSRKLGLLVMIPPLLYALTTVEVVLPQTSETLLSLIKSLVLTGWLCLAYQLTEILVYYESLLVHGNFFPSLNESLSISFTATDIEEEQALRAAQS